MEMEPSDSLRHASKGIWQVIALGMHVCAEGMFLWSHVE